MARHYFTTFSKSTGEKITGLYDDVTGEWSCSCVFGSWFRWGKHWKDKGTKCRHVEEIIRRCLKSKDRDIAQIANK